MMYYGGSMIWIGIIAGLVLVSLLVAFVALLFVDLTRVRPQERTQAEVLAEAVPVEESRFLTHR